MIFFIIFLFQDSVSGNVRYETTVQANVNIFDSNGKLLYKTGKNGGFKLLEVSQIAFPIRFEKKGFQTLMIYSDQLSNNIQVFLEKEKIFIGKTVITMAQRSVFEQLKNSIPVQSYELESNTKSVGLLKSQLSTRSDILFQESSGQGSAPIINGFRANKLLYVVNGIRFNNGFFKNGNTPYLSLINPIYYQHISIIHGASSLLFGSDAIGATLDYKTPYQLAPLQFFSGYSSADSYAYAGLNSAFQKKEALHQFSIYLSKSGNRKGGLKGNFSLSYPNGEMQTAFYQQNFDYDYTHQFKISQFSFGFHFAKQYLADDFFRLFYKKSEKYQYNPVQYMQAYIRLKTNYSQAKHLETTFYVNNFKENKNETKKSIRFYNDEITSIGLKSFFKYIINPREQINTGFDFLFEKTSTIAKKGNIFIQSKYPNNAEQNQFGFFLSYAKNLDKSKFTGGIRYSLTNSSIPKQKNPFQIVDLFKNFTLSLHSLNYSIGYEIALKKHTIYSILTSGFRSPNFDDLSKTGQVKKNIVAIPNYNLKAEKSLSFQLHYKWHNSHFHIRSLVFYTQLDNLIEANRTMVNSSSYFILSKDTLFYEHNENINRALLTGFNSQIYYYNSNFTSTIGIAYQFGENLSSNEPLSKIPPFRLSYTIKYAFNSVISISSDHIYSAMQNRLSSADRRDERILNTGTPSYYRFDLGVILNWKKFNMNIQLQNVTNQRYRNHASALNGLGRSVEINFEYLIY